MRFEQYLIEDVNELDSAITNIKRDCKKWLKESEYMVAFRGMKNKQQIIKQTVRKDRKPKDTSKTVHNMMNEYFNEKFGWNPRSEGMFCTGDLLEAARYGKAYAVFPIGDYRYVWSPTVRDSFMDMSKFSTWWIELTSFIFTDESEYMETAETKRMLKSYIDTNLSRGIRSNREIMVDCNEYYAIRIDALFKPENPDAPFSNVKDFIKVLKS